MKLILTTWFLLCAASLARAEDAPLYQQEPYDTIKLDEANRNAELRVQPLDLPDRVVPAKPNPTDELEIRLLDRPRKVYKLAWGAIVEIKLFEQRVLDEAEQLVQGKKLDEAFPYYEFLERRYPKTPGLAESHNKFLMAGAVDAFKREKYEECLALSWELYARSPNSKGVTSAILRAADKLIERRFSDEDFAAARALVQETADRLKDSAAPLASSWEEKLQGKAIALLAKAKDAAQHKQYSEAKSAIRLALSAWPEVPGGKELAATIAAEYPEVIVGVTALAPSHASASDSWEARRDGGLVSRTDAAAGPFHIETSDGKEIRFVAVEGQSDAKGKHPRQIVERPFPNTVAALSALSRDEIMVVDRVGPWEAAALATSGQAIVEPYRSATLHLLIPNLRRPLMQAPMFRRAVAHAIDRSGILTDRLSRGKLPSGGEIVDELFAKPATDASQPSETAAALRYDSGVAKLLAGYAMGERQDRLTELVLAYPAGEVSRLAAQAIAEQARAAGLSVRLTEVAAGELPAAAEKADLIYVEWTPLEPLAELPRLIGRHGLGGDAGPLVERLMREAQAAGPKDAADRIARLESAIGDETLVIPLWRLNNYVVYRRELTGVGKRPVTLYQNFKQWQLSSGDRH